MGQIKTAAPNTLGWQVTTSRIPTVQSKYWHSIIIINGQTRQLFAIPKSATLHRNKVDFTPDESAANWNSPLRNRHGIPRIHSRWCWVDNTYRWERTWMNEWLFNFGARQWWVPGFIPSLTFRGALWIIVGLWFIWQFGVFGLFAIERVVLILI